MTGNSMDAVDVVLTEFDGENMADVCTLSQPYSREQKREIDALRKRVITDQTESADLVKDTYFLQVHQHYIESIAEAVQSLLKQNNIDPHSVDAIGFHGKTLDHNPPSVAKKNKTLPFTTQMGSAQMLADLTGIPVIGDFRSALIKNGYEGAPLAGPHNAHVAKIEGDGIYINAGNTSNLAFIKSGKVIQNWDIGPFNEYTDNFVLAVRDEMMDRDGQYGQKGHVLPDVLQFLFDQCREFYEMMPPKSGDPAFYKTAEIFESLKIKFGDYRKNISLFYDLVRTFEYFSAYLVAHALCEIHEKNAMKLVLFGGGWKNQVVWKSFEQILQADGYILPEHEKRFAELRLYATNDSIVYSQYGTYMEARLFAELAEFYLDNKSWPLAEVKKTLILGNMRIPHEGEVNDYLSSAARGWQKQRREK